MREALAHCITFYVLYSFAISSGTRKSLASLFCRVSQLQRTMLKQHPKSEWRILAILQHKRNTKSIQSTRAVIRLDSPKPEELPERRSQRKSARGSRAPP